MNYFESLLYRIAPSLERSITDYSEEDFVAEAYRRGVKDIDDMIVPSTPSMQSVTAQQFKSAVMMARSGENQDRVPLLDIYERMEYDLGLMNSIETRILRTVSSGYRVVDKKTREKDTDAAHLLMAAWFVNWLKLAMSSEFYGPTVIQMTYLNEDLLLRKVKIINRKHYKPHTNLVVKHENDAEGWSLDHPVMQKYYMVVGDRDELGLLEKIAPCSLAKNFAFGAWSNMQRRFGDPFRWLTTKSTHDTRKKQLATIMREMGPAGWGIFNEGDDLKLIESAKSDPHKIYDEMIKRCNSEMDKRLIGQDGTSTSAEGQGTYGSMKVHQDIKDDRHKADRIFIKHLINDELFPMLVKISPAYSMLEGKEFEWDEFADLDIDTYIKRVTQLAQYFEIDVDQVEEKTGIRINGIRINGQPQPDPQPQPQPNT